MSIRFCYFSRFVPWKNASRKKFVNLDQKNRGAPDGAAPSPAGFHGLDPVIQHPVHRGLHPVAPGHLQHGSGKEVYLGPPVRQPVLPHGGDAPVHNNQGYFFGNKN